MLAEYGGPEWADEIAQLQLTAAWVRRKKFEAKLIANEVGALFAGGSQGSGKVPGHELLSMAGISL
jgi:hypothetical protein